MTDALMVYKIFYVALYEKECVRRGMPEVAEGRRRWEKDISWDSLTEIVYSVRPDKLSVQNDADQ
jgi:hypothetical protein